MFALYAGQIENPLRQRWAKHKHDIVCNIQSNALAKHNNHQLLISFQLTKSHSKGLENKTEN